MIDKMHRYLSIDNRRKIIKYGAVLIAAHFFWGLFVLRYVGESHELYLPLMAPAGLVGNFFLPVWLVIVAYHFWMHQEPRWSGSA